MSATSDPVGTADQDVSNEAADKRAVRIGIRIDDSTVLSVLDMVQTHAIGADLERWEASEQKALGGRPKPFSADAAVVGMLLAGWAHGRVNDTTVRDVLYHQITDAMRARLGIRTGNIGRYEAQPNYYRRVNHRLNSLIDVVDPSPWMKNRVVLKSEVESRKRDVSSAQMAEHADRLASVVHRILYASFMSMPRSLRRKWKGDLAIDGTPLRQFTRGTKKDSEWASCDPDCGWYMRDADDDPEKHAVAESKLPTAKVGAGEHRVADEKGRARNHKEAFYGLEAFLAIMCNNDPAGTAYHPNLVLGMVLDIPGARIGENGTLIAAQVARLTGEVGWLAGDRAYSNAKPEKFQLPTRALGYRHVFDYRKDQLGNQATFGHAIQVEGAWYCDCMPKALIEATWDYRRKTDDKKKIDKAGWRERLLRRRDHAMTVKERRPDGSMRLVSKCCRSKPSVTIPADGGAKFHQELEFGMPEHQARYAHMRNTNEGFNGTSKDGSHAGLGQASRRRKRGIAAQTLACAALLFAENMRRITSFVDKATTDANGDLVTKRRGRPRRRALGDYLPTEGVDAPQTAITPRYGDPPED